MQPRPVLLKERLPYAVVVVESDTLGVGEQAGARPEGTRKGVPRQNAKDDEDDDRHAEQREDHRGEPPGDRDEQVALAMFGGNSTTCRCLRIGR